MANDFGLDLLKYDTWNAEVPQCECGVYGTNEYLIFYCQRVHGRAFKNVLIEEEMPSALVALIFCNNEKVIRAVIDLLKVNGSIFDSCDTSWKMNPDPCGIKYN